MNPVVVKVHGVSKRFIIRKDKSLKERLVNFGRSRRHKDDFWALRDVDLEIRAGTTVGLIGPNGSGKSTLLKTIGGIIKPTSGEVLRRGRLAALLELGAGFHPDLTGRENVFLNASILGLSTAETELYFDDIVEFSGIADFIDTQVKFYSSGMYVRLAFAVAVHVNPDVLIVDEVLAVGDEPFQRKCIERIKAFQHAGKTIILVTHSLDQVVDLCDRAVVLERGHVIFDGEPGEAVKRLRNDFEIHADEHSASLDDTDDRPRIVSASLIGMKDGETLKPGKAIDFEVIAGGLSGLEDVVIGIGIDTPVGSPLFGTNTQMLGVALTPVDGVVKVTFRLTGLRLGGGEFSLHAAVATMGGGELVREPRSAVFHVASTPDSLGVVGADVRVTAGRSGVGRVTRGAA